MITSKSGRNSNEQKTTMKIHQHSLNRAIAVWTDWNRPGSTSKKYGGVGWYRIVNPLSKAKNAQTISGEHLKLGGDINSSISNAKYLRGLGNIWWFKYVDDQQAVMHMIAAKQVVGAKLVVDADDDMFNVHPQNYAYKFHYPGSPKQKILSYLFANADAITVSTEPLKRVMERMFRAPVTVLPNSIDESIWNHAQSRADEIEIFTEREELTTEVIKPNPEAIRIGWVCSVSHEQDAPVLLEPMKEILAKYPNVEFWCIGWKPLIFDELPRTYWVKGTSDYVDYPKFLCGLGLDISVAPLIKDEFNRSKSNIKWLESTMAGIPVVATDYDPYESIDNYKTGYLAKNGSQWVKYLSWLIENKEKRLELAKNAKKVVLEKFSSKKITPRYEEFIDSL